MFIGFDDVYSHHWKSRPCFGAITDIANQKIIDYVEPVHLPD